MAEAQQRNGFAAAVADALARTGARTDAPVRAMLADVDAWRGWLDAAQACVSGDEAARAARQRDPLAARRLLLAYALRRAVLAACTGHAPGDVPLSRMPNGRPVLDVPGMSCSLSHSANAVALAVSRAGAVGVDVEQLPRAGVMLEIEALVASTREAAALATLSATARADALLSLWVRKEALLKAAGVGLAVEMPAFDAPDGQAVRVPADPPLQAAAALLDAGSGFRLALALQVPGPPPASVLLERLQAPPAPRAS